MAQGGSSLHSDHGGAADDAIAVYERSSSGTALLALGGIEGLKLLASRCRRMGTPRPDKAASMEGLDEAGSDECHKERVCCEGEMRMVEY